MATINAWDSNVPVQIALGGTNATSFATTDGTVYFNGTSLVTTATGTANQVLTSNGSGSAPTYQSAGFKLIQTQTASNSASISFTSGIVSTINNYYVTMSGVQPVTNAAQLQMLWSTNGGSSYLNSGYVTGSLINAYNSATLSNTNSTTFCPLVDSISNTLYYNGFMFLFQLNTGILPYYTGRAFRDAGSNIQFYGENSTVSINAIQFIMSSGNISVGTFSLYSIAQ